MTVGLPSVSVQIVQWGKTDLTVRAVDALRRTEFEGRVEILVYDNASPGGPGPIADDDGVTLFRGDANLGFGPAHDLLAERARGDLLFILNNDTVVAPTAIPRLVERYLSDQRIAAVTPLYRDFDGRVLEMGAFLGGDASGWQLFRGAAHPPGGTGRMPFRVTYGSAAGLLVERRTFLDLDGFDDRFAPAYYEDTDLALRLAERGRTVVVEPRAVVFHYEGGTSGRDLHQGPKTHQLLHRTVFYRRWRETIGSRPAASFRQALNDLFQPVDGLRILWVSPHLPRPDKEAGHARIVRMLRDLRGDGHAVVLWAEHCNDPGRYGRMLEEMGVPWFGRSRGPRWSLRPRVEPLSDLGELLGSVDWDAVVISFPELASRMLPLVRSRRPESAVIVDDVDLHFVRQERAEEMGLELSHTVPKDVEVGVYAASDGVITASDEESAALETELPLLPTFSVTVDVPAPVEHPTEARDRVLFLGNFGHAPNVDAVQWWVEEIAPLLAARAGRDIPLRVVGAGQAALVEQLDPNARRRLDLAGWVEDLTPEFGRARVFVAPLRYGAGTKGKILAALAHGVPVVTTTVGAEGNASYIRDALVVCDGADETAAAVAALLEDDSRWERARRRSIETARRAVIQQAAIGEEFSAWVRRRVASKRLDRALINPKP